MIHHQDQLSLKGLPVFTQLKLETPLQERLALPSDACYLHIEEGEDHSLYAPARITATPGTVILSTCGLTVGHMITEQPRGSMSTTIVHFNRELLNVVFEGEKPALWEELQTPVNQFMVQTAADALVQHYFDSVAQLFQNKAAVSPFMLKLKLKEIILLLLQTDSAEPIRQIIKSLFSERTFTFKEIVDAHIYTFVSIEGLAQLTHCSLSTFKRKFREIYDSSPAKYITARRLEKVAEALRTSDEAVSQIGYAWGFESPEHLSRAFKKQFGVAPSAYRLSFLVK
jgi:AraC-like DNA-binding protein